jgi:methylmalonyl-CoA/ethylmalonyl-CoA epimerase
MKIKRIEHVAIAVNDMRQSMDMLEKLFDLKLEYAQETELSHIAMYPVGETYIELLQGKSEQSSASKWISKRGQGLFHLCFEVENIDQALEELRAKNVKLLNETPKIGHGGCRIAFIDPESTGNFLIELAEIPAGH